jgi:hypothetical protein
LFVSVKRRIKHLTHLPRIREVPDSYLGPRIRHPDWECLNLLWPQYKCLHHATTGSSQTFYYSLSLITPHCRVIQSVLTTHQLLSGCAELDRAGIHKHCKILRPARSSPACLSSVLLKFRTMTFFLIGSIQCS